MQDTNDIGQGRAYPDPIDKERAKNGTYKDACEDLPENVKLPTGNMPMAPAPSPFKLGPL